MRDVLAVWTGAATVDHDTDTACLLIVCIHPFDLVAALWELYVVGHSGARLGVSAVVCEVGWACLDADRTDRVILVEVGTILDALVDLHVSFANRSAALVAVVAVVTVFAVPAALAGFDVADVARGAFAARRHGEEYCEG
jgi:hypothetical protein